MIALDYDGTYSRYPELWDEFIANCKARGIKIVCVSCRRDTLENRQEMPISIPLYLTGLSPKQWFLEQRGLKVDIWIDDDPKTILYGH